MQLCSSLSILWHCLSLGLEWKLTFSSPVATAEFSKFAGILSAALSQHHLSVSIFLPFHTVHWVLKARILKWFAIPFSSGPHSVRSSKKKESSRKTSICALLTMPKTLTVWVTINYGKFWNRWEYQTTWPASWETYMQVRKQQLELNMEQQTGSK